MAYFERAGESRFRPTEHTSGAWRVEDQHVGPSLGLLAHEIERDRDRRRGDDLVITRLGFDILGTMPVESVSTDVVVLRPGRTIELVEATLAYAGRVAVRARAWLQRPEDTSAVAGSGFATIAPRESTPPWDPATLWSGSFLASAEVRRRVLGTGRATVWVRPRQRLLDDEPVSGLAAAAGVLDIANGMATRADPAEWIYPNVDLTAHLFRPPVGAWVGFDITVSFGAGGVGLTSSVLHDEAGPFGTQNQILTVRPRRPDGSG